MFAPSVEIAAALASTMAQRSLKVGTAVGPSPAFASVTSKQLRARRPLAKPKRARPPQSSAAKLWAQASAAATFTRPPFYKGARGESTKRRGQRVPQSKALSPNRRSCAFKRGTYLQLLALKSLQPWPQLWPNARSKSLQPSAPREGRLRSPSARDRPSLAQ